ncbi:MAG: UDP-3-O-[3-hydroxymyristoyl] N-acetylglucosamine deacetylase [Candidatus Marinimicrobia bacterium]|nr:UDP-3-O-[3-hydroxymyristoyl] N-acetylglucosamine deacetylase [Candidatus Neomarinimicrobiota bacterium]|tara:strand:- start:17067 stop:17996 length:930 start_codon:yes stop_codon:yes gene_type:complete
MSQEYQQTLNNKVSFSGVGLHSGEIVNVTLTPSNSNSGIIFKREDLDKNNEIIANFKNVSSAKLCTKIENSSGASVSTIEHLMAAFYMCGIDNLVVKLNGSEVPIMDGSAKDFVKMIKKSGLKPLKGKRKFVKIKKKVELKDDDKLISINPCVSEFTVKFKLDYKNNPLIQMQSNSVSFKEKNLDHISSARTFCLYEDVEKIKSVGLAKGGSLDNAIVVKGNKVLNEGGLRFEKEFVNHKILDLAGDFMLCGVRVIGSVECLHGGHALTNKFLRKIFSDKNNYEIVDSESNNENVRKIVPLNKRLAVNA